MYLHDLHVVAPAAMCVAEAAEAAAAAMCIEAAAVAAVAIRVVEVGEAVVLTCYYWCSSSIRIS